MIICLGLHGKINTERNEDKVKEMNWRESQKCSIPTKEAIKGPPTKPESGAKHKLLFPL